MPVCRTKKSTLSCEHKSRYIPYYRITLISHTLMNHHDDISAAVIRKLNYLGRQAESGIAANTAMLALTQRKRVVDARQEKNICQSIKNLCTNWASNVKVKLTSRRPSLPSWCHLHPFPLQYDRPSSCLPLLINSPPYHFSWQSIALPCNCCRPFCHCSSSHCHHLCPCRHTF